MDTINYKINKKLIEKEYLKVVRKITSYIQKSGIKDKMITMLGTEDKATDYFAAVIDRSLVVVNAKYGSTGRWLKNISEISLYQSLGDTIGYHNGNWEFNYDEINVGPEYANDLIAEYISLGGVNDMSIDNWLASDDTIMYSATYKVLTEKDYDPNQFGERLREEYIRIIPKMEARHPGQTIMRSLNIQKNIKWNQLPYSSDDIGSGSSMRSGCIGIFYFGEENREKLISLAVECSRITHNSAIAILGSISSALLTAFAIEMMPINEWPHKLFKILKSNLIDKYMEKSRPAEYELYIRDKVLFVGQWEKYITLRFSGTTPRLDLKLLKHPVHRIKYLSDNFSKGHQNFPGSCADDSVIFAYDSVLESGGIYEKVLVYSILHHGDSDTVGSIAFSLFWAYYKSESISLITRQNIKKLEFYDEINEDIAKNVPDRLYHLYQNIFVYEEAIKIMNKIL